MRRELARVALASVLLAALAIAVIACNDSNDSGGGGALTLEEYFNELERISDNADSAAGNIDPPDLAADASFEESRAAFIDYFGQAAGVVEDTVDDVRDLTPPDEVSDEHERFIDALAEETVVSDSLLERLSDADEDEFNDILGGENPFEATGAELGAACGDLQEIADDNQIDVDLHCDE